MFAQSLWSLAAAAFFSMMAACVKYCNDVFGPLELVFYRSLFTTLFVFITVSLRGETFKDPISDTASSTRCSGFCFGSYLVLYVRDAAARHQHHADVFNAALFSTEFYFAGALEERTARMAPDRLYSSRLCRHCGRYASVFLSGDAVSALLCLFVAFIDLFGYWQIRFLGRVHEPSWRVVFYYSLFCTVGCAAGYPLF